MIFKLLLLLWFKLTVSQDVSDVAVVSTSTTEQPKNYETYNINMKFKDRLSVEVTNLNETLRSVMNELKAECACDVKLENITNRLINETKKHIAEELKRLFEKQSESYDLKLDNIYKAIEKLQIKEKEKITENCLEIQKIDNESGIYKIQPNGDSKPFSLEEIPENCLEIQNIGNKSGIYKIQPKGASEPFSVFCDMETRGGGWIYLIRRFDGSQNFDLNWDEYKNGFGNVSKEMWLGLEHLYQLTSNKTELLVELVDWDLKKVQVHYDRFQIGNEQEGYPIMILEGYSGETGDALKNHIGMKFTTKDQKHDTFGTINCAIKYIGGWWYHGCFHCKLTGNYFTKNMQKINQGQGIHWNLFHTDTSSLKEAKMMIR